MSSMRRKDKEIKEKVVMEEILREQSVGRLATAVDGVPYIVPVNYVYREGKIIFHSHVEGKKMMNIRRNPHVCFEVDTGEIKTGDKPCDYSWKYMSVIAFGEAKEIRGFDEKLAALRLIVEKHAPGKGKMLTGEDFAKFEKLVVVEILVTEMTGKRSPASG
ncbi:MAG: pyridoxamine 5'-phosphate oxidase family protein [Candidatus Bathyarchaeota archaeon]|nr:pyridoxamine 5'-phosphate oxidase family protein [Candidatus Bathyarchaeota archaeon]